MTDRIIKRILVVDDEPGARMVSQQFLTRMGCSCEVARNGTEALEMLRMDPFDLVLSDIRMKGMDGVELMKSALDSHPHLSFIIMTGHSADYSYCDIVSAGATDYIYKPFELGELRAKLDRIEREKKVMRQLQESNQELRKSFEKLRQTMEGTIQAMALTVEKRDPYTAGHQRRVASLATAVARELGVPDQQIDGIHLAGVIHDLGKIYVPAEILSKPSRLSEIEFAMIKTHPQTGYDILKTIEFPWPIAQIVYQHHEKVDGAGYPRGLKGDEILMEARILAVADVVEAMASHRPYRAALGADAALEEIERMKGSHFDPAPVEACLRLFREGRFKFGDGNGVV
jgi:putative nucleotidyltransferase with HDIG domain